MTKLIMNCVGWLMVSLFGLGGLTRLTVLIWETLRILKSYAGELELLLSPENMPAGELDFLALQMEVERIIQECLRLREDLERRRLRLSTRSANSGPSGCSVRPNMQVHSSGGGLETGTAEIYTEEEERQEGEDVPENLGEPNVYREFRGLLWIGRSRPVDEIWPSVGERGIPLSCCLPTITEENDEPSAELSSAPSCGPKNEERNKNVRVCWSSPLPDELMGHDTRRPTTSCTRESVPLDPRKYETLNSREKLELLREIQRLNTTSNLYEILGCPTRASREEARAAYGKFMKTWISKYGSFAFHDQEGFEGTATALLSVTTAYLVLISPITDFIQILEALRDGPAQNVPEAWGLVKKKQESAAQDG